MDESSITKGSHAAWEMLRDHLDAIRKASGEELLRYPQPTAECDLHYRDLLERRSRVNEELSALKAREPDAPDDPDWLAWFNQRISASAFTDEPLRQEIARLIGGEKVP